MTLANHRTTLILVHRLSWLALMAAMALAADIGPAAESPRERQSLDAGWRFHLGDAPDAGSQFDHPEVKDLAKTRVEEIGEEANFAAAMREPRAAVMGLSHSPAGKPRGKANMGSKVSFVQSHFNDRGWRQLDLPHDWAVELPFDPKADCKHGFKPIGRGFPENSIGWYRRQFDLPAADKGEALWLEFDGVYRNALVWLNGHCLGRHLSGYSSFRYDIRRFANFGGENVLVVRVDASRFEGWFYEGAGIYRHVWLEKTSPLHIAPDGVFVWSRVEDDANGKVARVSIQVDLRSDAQQDAGGTLVSTILDAGGKRLVQVRQPIVPEQAQQVTQTARIESPSLWSPESPTLYKLITTIERNGKLTDRVESEFGIRTVAFDPERGFLLNGKPYTIKGTCNHQDHAGVGSALPDALQYFRVRKLKAMGCNAVRTSHNPPTPELLQACDRLGLLVMDENRRMDTNESVMDDWKGLILRDRNHPSVFLWSLGNEEPFLQGTNTGACVAATMQALAHKLDPTRLCTVAMNGKWGQGFSKVIDVQGFNYGTKGIDAYHAKYPAQPEIGTETASTVATRGVYAKDAARGYVSSYGDDHPRWGAKPWEWWPYFAAHPFTAGGFVWTGFDYRGEPTPYKWPCISSHFGLMDTCGFPKDIYYYYQSWWTDQPVLHVMPHWNWPGREGQEILVRVFTNCKEVELSLNGKCLFKAPVPENGFIERSVRYEPGVLSATGYDRDKLIAETKVETTGAPAAVQLLPDRLAVNADGQDVSVVAVSVVDAQGRLVPDSDNLIHFQLCGPGEIIGVGNGDPSSCEADKAGERKVFHGLAQVIVQSSRQAGMIQLTAAAPGLRTATLQIGSESSGPGHSSAR